MAKKDLVGTKNAGYLIVKQGNDAVLGFRDSKYGESWVAWHYDFNSDGEANYYWGRYGGKNYAEDCFNKKEQGEYSGGF